MCQLLGMNCATPTDFTFSFRGFRRRGGVTDIHSHGWGLAIYQGSTNNNAKQKSKLAAASGGVRTFLDCLPASESPIAELVSNYPIKTYNCIAHIRYATQGCVSLENVHPFTREMWGIQWTFAHNGDVPHYNTRDQLPLLGKTRRGQDEIYTPVGDTDSEAVFCSILNALRAEFHPHGLPTLPILYETIQRLCHEIIELEQQDNEEKRDPSTILNFMLGCGPYTLFCFSWPGQRPGSSVWNGLHYIVREPPFSTASLVDDEYTIDFAEVTTPQDRVAVITTKPLTNEEGWKEFQRGELLLFDRGLPYHSPRDCVVLEQEGRGLYSKQFPKAQTTTTAQ